MNTNRTKPEFWIIDLDTPGIASANFYASGPYPTQKAAEDAVIAETRHFWESSCNCLQSDNSRPWQAPQLIVQVIRKVEPQITANITLITSTPA